VSLIGGTTAAFAGWTAQPTAATPSQVSAAEAACRSKLPFSGLPLVLSEQRGPFTFQIYADDRTSAGCIDGAGFQNESGVESSAPIVVPADQLLLSSSHAPVGGGDGYSFAEGRAGANVTGATLLLSDGQSVTATVEGGWFVAWWPGDSAAASAQLTTSDGPKTQTFPGPKQLAGPGDGGSFSSGSAGSHSQNGTSTTQGPSTSNSQ
jgi:hypothetical protein